MSVPSLTARTATFDDRHWWDPAVWFVAPVQCKNGKSTYLCSPSNVHDIFQPYLQSLQSGQLLVLLNFVNGDKWSVEVSPRIQIHGWWAWNERSTLVAVKPGRRFFYLACWEILITTCCVFNQSFCCTRVYAQIQGRWYEIPSGPFQSLSTY